METLEAQLERLEKEYEALKAECYLEAAYPESEIIEDIEKEMDILWDKIISVKKLIKETNDK